MRVALVNSYNRALSWFFYAQGMSTPPYGMCRAARVLAQAGHEVVVIDGRMLREPALRLAARISEWGPDAVVVGAFPELHVHTFMGTSAFPYDVELCRALLALPHPPRIALGGYLACRFPARTRMLARADAVVASLTDLWELAGGDPSAAAGGLGGSPAYEHLVPDIRSYGVDQMLYLDEARPCVRPVLPVLTAFGCPHRCAFCATPAQFDHAYTVRPIDQVLDEIQAGVRDLGVRAWSVWDDTFTVDPGRVRAFCRGLEARALDIRWWCFGQARWVNRHAELLPDLRRAGCRMMWLGVESVDPDRLSAYSKDLAPDEARAAVDCLLLNGIQPTTSFIMGEPDETERSLERRVAASESFLQRGALNVHTLLIPVPGTTLFEDLNSHGRIARSDLRLYSGTRTIVDYGEQLPAAKLESAFYQAYVGSILSASWRDAHGRVDLWDTACTPDGGSPRDMVPTELEGLARREYEVLLQLEHGDGASIDVGEVMG